MSASDKPVLILGESGPPSAYDLVPAVRNMPVESCPSSGRAELPVSFVCGFFKRNARNAATPSKTRSRLFRTVNGRFAKNQTVAQETTLFFPTAVELREVEAMAKQEFADYYEILEVSPNANSETIEKIFRYLAPRYHPDAEETADRSRFNNLIEAYDTLRNPSTRVAYDIEYQKHLQHTEELLSGAEATGGDSDDRHRMLSLFYAQRRRDMKNPGVGIMKLSQILGCPMEVLEFHLWYFREKGWISREEDGLLAISSLGVDEIEARVQSHTPSEKRIEDKSSGKLEAVAV